MSSWIGRLITIAVLVTHGAGCDPGVAGRVVVQQDEIIVERRPDPTYDELFPYYAELCAVSQFRSKTKSTGGVAGHAVMYVKGACRDESAAFPQLRRCARQATHPYEAEHGVGVSVNRWFRSVNWVAIPGNALFYEGRLAAGERITQTKLDSTVREAIDDGLFRGVELHDYPTPAPERSLEDFVMRQSVGTDFALRFARSTFCARVPITEEMVGEIIEFLNELNREYATGEADFNWSGSSDNCVHTLRNALAAASVWSPLSVRAIKTRQIFNLAIPANEFVNLARLGTEGPIDDYGRIYRDSTQREALVEFGWLPTRHGALVKSLPPHENNDLYDTTLRLFVAQSPFHRGATEATIRLLGDERFVTLGPNLQHWRQVYDAILAERDEEASGLSSLRGDRFRRVRRRYYAYIEEQRAEVEAMLARLSASNGPGAPLQADLHR